jgi:hypothetical protein
MADCVDIVEKGNLCQEPVPTLTGDKRRFFAEDLFSEMHEIFIEALIL